MEGPTLCFSCGQPVTTPPRLNDMPDGSPCKTCRERALEIVPAPLPRPVADPGREVDAESELGFLPAEGTFDVDELGDDFPEPA